MLLEKSPCPEEQLAQLLDQTLSAELTKEVTEHVGACKSCQQRLEQLAAEPSIWKETRLVLSDPALKQTLRQNASPASSTGASQKSDSDKRRLASLVPGLAPSEMQGSLGSLDGYEVLEVIGFGGMGVVLRAFETALARPVAIKILHPHLATHAAARRRFAREARAAAAVNHPSVVPIHAVNAEANPPYIVMGFVPGGSLQDRLDREGPLGIGDALRIGCQVADALAAAHAQGLVHRDVKPGNILLDHGQDRVLLSDFGLAQALDDASLTASGMIAGTPQYMSPEQARGESVDARSDIFSLGGVLYAMTTGRAPFRGDSTLAILNKIGRETVKPVCEVMPEVPEWFSRLIELLMANDLQQRPSSAGEVSQLMRDALAHLRSPATSGLPELLAPKPIELAEPRKPVEPVKPAVDSPKKLRGMLLGLAVVFLVAATIPWLWNAWNSQSNVEQGSVEVVTYEQPLVSGANLFWNDGLDDDLTELDRMLRVLESE